MQRYEYCGCALRLPLVDLLYGYKSTNPDAMRVVRARADTRGGLAMLRAVYLLYWCNGTNTDAMRLRARARRYKWGVSDAASPTAQLQQDAFADGIHPRPYVYEELNNLLLNSVCAL